MLQIGQEIQTRVEKLIFPGQGLLRYQGWVIFVDDVAAGEEVIVQITEKKKSYFRAKLLQVVIPKQAQELGFGLKRKSRDSTIEKAPILEIWGPFRSLNPEALAQPKFQF